MEQKYIYVVFSSGHTGMSHFIKFMTQNKYNHVSVSFERNLNTMYSFSRYNQKAALYGGLVEESILRYYLSGVDEVKICRIPVTEESFEMIRERVKRMIAQKEQYIYNTLSAVLMPIKKRYYIRQTYTCVEFVAMLLRLLPNLDVALDNYISIRMLEEQLEKYTYYEGELWRITESSGWGNDDYSKEMKIHSVFYNTVLHFGKLFLRFIKYGY